MNKHSHTQTHTETVNLFFRPTCVCGLCIHTYIQLKHFQLMIFRRLERSRHRTQNFSDSEKSVNNIQRSESVYYFASWGKNRLTHFTQFNRAFLRFFLFISSFCHSKFREYNFFRGRNSERRKNDQFPDTKRFHFIHFGIERFPNGCASFVHFVGCAVDRKCETKFCGGAWQIVANKYSFG